MKKTVSVLLVLLASTFSSYGELPSCTDQVFAIGGKATPSCLNVANGTLTFVFFSNQSNCSFPVAVQSSNDPDFTTPVIFNVNIIDANGILTIENRPSGGSYTITFDDTTTGPIIVPGFSPIRFRPPTVTPVTCCGAGNGTILLVPDQVAGGTPPYVYSIDTNVGFIPVGDPFTHLEAGPYRLIVVDANGCESNSIRVIVDPAERIKICAVCTIPARCNTNNGIIRIFAKSKAPLQYALQGLPFQESPVFTHLAPGKYRVIVNRKGDDSSECVTCCTRVTERSKCA